MGKKIEEFFERAMEIGEMKAKMRLSIMTGVPIKKASTINDSDDLIRKFNQAFSEMEKEFV